ncbi:hypothetical protein [Streptomyces sp. NPDC058228]
MTDITEQVTSRLTDAERDDLSRKVGDANKRSEQGRGGGQR